MTTAIAPVEPVVALTAEQELYRLEKAKRAERNAPAMAAAAAEMQRQLDLAAEARKPGRPRKGPPLILGAPGYSRRRTTEPEPDAPGRPEWLDLPMPPSPTSPAHRATPPMPSPSIEKTCRRSGQTFTAGSNGAKFCHTCPECRAAEGGTKTPKRETKAAKPETPRRRVETGYRAATAPRAAGPYQATIEKLRKELAELVDRQEQVTVAIKALQQIGGASA